MVFGGASGVGGGLLKASMEGELADTPRSNPWVPSAAGGNSGGLNAS